ncbi:hypothetical protein SPRG_01259 [Saprolegnia parasitica CBS 223.65]|uniref:PX domain-containing protein n=1 Tax=Saprolegnia parasitica (strain CBS 223.65) TaxID=695850 RepID=A0A067CTY0_SAPPC|nr:hypothetical protein SPRG_01259 [Saprolegnia parasitica CBS 223.65]KDO33983.1 hypothetical protein SPRG_01259 [Saprolegnia parasitica CBS 223.65]|eukprot:XP_012194871.1 hypothetical protein SPRG_01259 [Saprolegnia parasitica CBS 223.65]
MNQRASRASSVLSCMRLNRADSSVLCEITAEIVRVDDDKVKSPEYVISIQLPRASAHLVARTYSEWRRLYKSLLASTDAADDAACDCVMGSCPFWTLHALLRSVDFPKKTLFFSHSPKVLDDRKRDLSEFLTSLLAKLQHFKTEFEAASADASSADLPNWQLAKCKVLDAIEAFLGLDANVVGQLHRAASGRRMNLRGWQSDRKNLYFLPTAVAV